MQFLYKMHLRSSILAIFLWLAFAGCIHKSEPKPTTQTITQPIASPTQDISRPNTTHAHTKVVDEILTNVESHNRVIWQKPDLVIGQFSDLTGKTVADIGAGSGYFAFRLVQKAQKVIAIDIDNRFITFMDTMKTRLSAELQPKFETRLTTPNNPSLQPEETDAVLIVDTYGYITNRKNYLKRLKAGMKKGGEILIIDFKKGNLPPEIAGSFTIGIGAVVHELESAGFVITRVENTILDYQYIIHAVKPQKE